MTLLVNTGEVVLVVVALSVATFVTRYGWLLVRARTPRVQLSAITQAARRTGEKEVEPHWVSSLLREELTKLRLSATEAIPEVSAGPPLLEIVEGIGEGVGDKSQLGRALGRLFRAIFPEAAYEVSATLRPATSEGGTISVQVVDRTHRHGTWVGTGRNDASWREAARTAAAGIAGALYPQLGKPHKGPWASWRRPVPAKLVSLQDEARRHEKHNRLEQAMGAYHKALDRDPLNPNLRLRIAMLQERLELHLGAWATYRAIADETHRGSWKAANRRARLLALYRLAILLGNEKVASSWISPADDPSEEKQKVELRRALKAERQLVRASWWKRFPTLARMFPVEFVGTSPTRLLDALGRDDQLDPGLTLASLSEYKHARRTRGEWLGRQLEQDSGENSEDAVKRIRGLLEIVSLTHLEQLDTRLRRKPPWRPWRWMDWWRYRPPLRRSLEGRELSLCAVRVSKLVARIRIVESAKAHPQVGDLTARRARWARRRLLLRWPFAPKPWRRPARWLRPRHRVADRRDDAWQYHYNAACAASRALPRDMPARASERAPSDSRLVAAGIEQLEEYVHRAGGELVKAQADWIAREDDDLVALRKTDDYEQWGRHHLPQVPSRRSPDLKLDTTRVAARIAHDGALIFAERWRARADRSGIGAESIAEWWRHEADAWRTVIELFERHNGWQDRWRSIDGLQICLRIDGDAVSLDAAHRVEDRAGRPDLARLLNGLCGMGNATGWSPEIDLRAVQLWARERADDALAASHLDELSRRPLMLSRRQEARRAATIWRSLARAIESELDDDDRETPGELTLKCLDDIREMLAQGNGLAGAGPTNPARSPAEP
jgi:hypothetical protein